MVREVFTRSGVEAMVDEMTGDLNCELAFVLDVRTLLISSWADF